MPQPIEFWAVVFEGNPKERVSSTDGLFLRVEEANEFRDNWNRDIGACESRVATVVKWTVR